LRIKIIDNLRNYIKSTDFLAVISEILQVFFYVDRDKEHSMTETKNMINSAFNILHDI